MPTDFVRALNDYNASTYFLLPLIQLNKFDFAESNFVNSYVNRMGTVLTVEIVDPRLSPSFRSHPEYLGEREDQSYAHIWFSLPEKWDDDFKKYCRGEWSLLSDDAKTMIRDYSGLTYRASHEDNKSTITDARLLALDKSPILREKWEAELGLQERGNLGLPDDQELLSAPSESSFNEPPLFIDHESKSVVSNSFEEQLGREWYSLLRTALGKPVVTSLLQHLETRREVLQPKLEDIFRPYRSVQPSQLRVLILGDCPQSTPGTNDGLAFSRRDNKTSEALQIMFGELERSGFGARFSGDLSDWAEQGVMLLNVIPTTEQYNSKSPHCNIGWEYFIGQTMRSINLLPQELVVMAWGSIAQNIVIKYLAAIPEHLILRTCHPSAQNYSKSNIRFEGCNHFVTANEHLKENWIAWVPPA